MEESRSNLDFGDGGAQGNLAVDSHMSSTLLTEVLTYMDPDVYEAAMEGRIETFNHYPNPLDLDRLVTLHKNNALHVYLTTSTTEASIEFVQQLVNLCPSLIMRANNIGEIPLHIAVKKGLHDVVKVLIDECKAQFDDLERGTGAAREMLKMRNNEKETALHMAVRRNSLEVVDLLTREDPEYQHSANNQGETPIYTAARRQNLEFVTKILDTCTSLEYRGPEGRTALHAALLSFGINMKDIMSEIITKQPELMKVSDDNGWIPLHYAAYSHFNVCVKLLLEHDRFLAHIPVKDSNMTALHLATLCGEIESMKEIMRKCPDSCELVDKRGWNVFHYATVSKCYYDEDRPRDCYMLEKDNSKVWECLLKYPNIKHLIHEPNVNGVTPYELFEYYWSSFTPPFIKDVHGDMPDEMKAREIVELKEDVDIGVGPNGHIHIKQKGSSKTWDFGGIMSEDELKAFEKANDSHLVVVALIATVTFAAAFTLPGATEKGVALLRESPYFQTFIISDALAMVLSTISIFIHFATALFKLDESERWFILARAFLAMMAMAAMVLAFITGTCAVLTPSLGLSITIWVIGLTFVVFTLYRMKWTLLGRITKFTVVRFNSRCRIGHRLRSLCRRFFCN